MKKITLIFILISSYTFGQNPKIDLVINKLKNDPISLNEFTILGRFYTNNLSFLWTVRPPRLDPVNYPELKDEFYTVDLYNINIYFNLVFNDLSERKPHPFCKFINSDSLIKEYEIIMNKNKIFKYGPKISGGYIDNAGTMNKVWKKRNAKKLYKKFISNKKNYNQDFLKQQPDSVHLDYMNQFLDHYYIINFDF